MRVVLEDGEMLGILSRDEALEAARNRGLDLVEVAPAAKPPVCKVMDYGKFSYLQAKKQKEAKKNQKQVIIKEVKFRPKIEEHDYNFKLKHAQRFLEDGAKVKATIMYRGREMAHTELGRDILDKVVADMEGLCTVESPPKLEGRNMSMMLAPVKNK
ncbi:translation initiation factor IF-3 [Desulfurispira natronophila]|uniref:Translation initiation factor IF-3 n=2 Tax=Desulfurispira natronophila TaxID=682562 RepID=A0A7W8DH15_9BACT|nr:translation initiation factor IF-3 [Desulfurispira natronophila]